MIKPYQLLMAPAEEGADLGGDRGDDFTPTDDDTPPKAPELDPEEADVDPENPDKGEADPEPEQDAKPKGKDQRIPLSRHKDILAKEREQRAALEAKLAQYEKGSQVASLNEDITTIENVVLKLEKEYTTLLADGEIDKATATMARIRAAERQINDAKNDMKLQASIAQATEQARYDVALERVEDAYPSLNPDSDDFDKEALGEVVEMKQFYQQMRGMTPTKALQAAVKKVVGQDTKAQERATDVTPKVDAKDVAAERKRQAVAKTLAATGKQPASTSKIGLDSDKAGGSLTAKDVMKMAYEDFKKLPDDVLARMRGDEFA